MSDKNGLLINSLFCFAHGLCKDALIVSARSTAADAQIKVPTAVDLLKDIKFPLLVLRCSLRVVAVVLPG